jgi:hypothetical protein
MFPNSSFQSLVTFILPLMERTGFTPIQYANSQIFVCFVIVCIFLEVNKITAGFLPNKIKKVVVEKLYYKPEGHEIESRCEHWISSIYLILPAALWLWGLPGNSLWSKVGPALKAGHHTAICEPVF